MECKKIKQEIQISKDTASANNSEIEKEKRIIDGIIVPISDIKLEIMNFQAGWLSFLQGIGFTTPTSIEIQESVTAFVRNADSDNRNS